jgi:hypothetical protein
MRPGTVAVPTLKRGAAFCGTANDALISISESLTVGRRCRTCPVSQPAVAGATPKSANSEAGNDASTVAPNESARNWRLPAGMKAA